MRRMTRAAAVVFAAGVIGGSFFVSPASAHVTGETITAPTEAEPP